MPSKAKGYEQDTTLPEAKTKEDGTTATIDMFAQSLVNTGSYATNPSLALHIPGLVPAALEHAKKSQDAQQRSNIDTLVQADKMNKGGDVPLSAEAPGSDVKAEVANEHPTTELGEIE